MPKHTKENKQTNKQIHTEDIDKKGGGVMDSNLDVVWGVDEKEGNIDNMQRGSSTIDCDN